MRRLGPGSWVGLQRYTSFAGSFGLPVKDRHSGDLMLLTAAHVIGGLFPISTQETGVDGYGDLPDGQHHETSTGPLPAISFDLGQLERSIPPTRAQSCTVDAAVARVSSDRELRNHLEGRPISGVRDIRDAFDTEIPIQMYGACSKKRDGILNTAPVVERLRLGKTQHLVFYQHACHVRSTDGEPFAVRGDSGSILVDEECNAVAMVVGVITDSQGEPTSVAVVTPLVPALDELEVDIYPGEAAIATERAVPFEETNP